MIEINQKNHQIDRFEFESKEKHVNVDLNGSTKFYNQVKITSQITSNHGGHAANDSPHP